MSTRTIATLNALAFGLLLPTAPALDAQYLGGGAKTAAEIQLADLEQMRDKFLSLGQAFPEALYDWRPMEGVRSVRNVFALITVEAALFPTMWGFEAPPGSGGVDFQAESARVNALTREELSRELAHSFEHLLDIVRGLTNEGRARQVEFFGLTVDLGTAVTLMANDMHEHLGQAIAYARSNEIVPPWSAGGQ